MRNVSNRTSQPLVPSFIIGCEDSGKRVGQLQLTERSYKASMRTSAHEHDYACLDLVINGIASDSYRGLSRFAPAGTVLYYAPGESHTWSCGDQGAKLLHLIIPSGMLIKPRGNALEDGCDLSATRAAGIAFQILLEYRCADKASNLAIESLSLELLSEIFGVHNCESKPPQWMNIVINLLHYAPEGGINLQFIASEVGVHPGHLARSFRAWNRCTPGQYLRHLRLSSAAVQLANSQHSLVEIALDAEFADQPHFCRIFKQHFGVSPFQYRLIMSSA